MTSIDFLGLEGKTVLVAGVANRKSVAFHVGERLAEVGARPAYVVHTEARKEELAARLGDAPIFVCDVAVEREVERLASEVSAALPPLAGLVHSIAHARYRPDAVDFHAVRKEDFLRAVDVSCFSLIALARALEERFEPGASVVTISISHTSMAAENYGYMGPVKAALDSSVAFLAKSFSSRGVRFNAVKAGLLKTASSAGIPGYADSWLFGEAATLRKRGLTTGEVADVALFLLSPRSSGVNAQGVVVDAGMGVNFFDRDIVRKAARSEDAR
jgi:enoyl-[acyl-carrier protein] reductase I